MTQSLRFPGATIFSHGRNATIRKAFVLCPLLLLAALMSGCGYTSQRLIVVRDIAAGEVIQEGDLQPLGDFAHPFRPESWGWAKVSDRSKVIGHKAKNMIGTGSRFHMSEIEP